MAGLTQFKTILALFKIKWRARDAAQQEVVTKKILLSSHLNRNG